MILSVNAPAGTDTPAEVSSDDCCNWMVTNGQYFSSGWQCAWCDLLGAESRHGDEWRLAHQSGVSQDDTPSSTSGSLLASNVAISGVSDGPPYMPVLPVISIGGTRRLAP